MSKCSQWSVKLFPLPLPSPGIVFSSICLDYIFFSLLKRHRMSNLERKSDEPSGEEGSTSLPLSLPLPQVTSPPFFHNLTHRGIAQLPLFPDPLRLLVIGDPFRRHIMTLSPDPPRFAVLGLLSPLKRTTFPGSTRVMGCSQHTRANFFSFFSF